MKKARQCCDTSGPTVEVPSPVATVCALLDALSPAEQEEVQRHLIATNRGRLKRMLEKSTQEGPRLERAMEAFLYLRVEDRERLRLWQAAQG